RRGARDGGGCRRPPQSPAPAERRPRPNPRQPRRSGADPAVKPLWFAVGLAIPAVVVVLLLGSRKPETRGVEVDRFPASSRLVHGDLNGLLLKPHGAGPGRPLLVLLHGRGASPSSFLAQGLVPALRELGPQAPVVLLPDGGAHSYWHDRRDGKWGTYLIREAIPLALRLTHADPRRVAIGGESMGG